MSLRLLAHDEVGCGLRPRHPIVCIIDLAGLTITLALLAMYPQKLVVVVLPLAIAALYAASFVYHWLPANETRQKLDHVMIAVVIMMTYVPFWGKKDLLPEYESATRIAVLGGMFLSVCAIKTLFISWHKTGG